MRSSDVHEEETPETEHTKHLESLERRDARQYILLREVEYLNILRDFPNDSLGLGGLLANAIQLREQFLRI